MPWFGNTLEEVLVPSAARTASGSQASNENYRALNDVRAELHVTAVSGTTPTLDVVLETTVDGVDWDAVATFTQRTAAGRQVLDATVRGNRFRARWTVGGVSASFTFAVTVVAEP